jgi:hypothetical protein
MLVGGDDLRDVARHLAVGRPAGDERRHGDRQRLNVCLRDVDADHGCGRSRAQAQKRACGRPGAEHENAASAYVVGGLRGQVDHRTVDLVSARRSALNRGTLRADQN